MSTFHDQADRANSAPCKCPFWPGRFGISDGRKGVDSGKSAFSQFRDEADIPFMWKLEEGLTMRFARGLAIGMALVPHMVLAQASAVPAHIAVAGSGNCTRLGSDIPALAGKIVTTPDDEKWRRQIADWLIDQIARGQADELLSGEKSTGKKPTDYVDAYKGSRDIVELHQAEIDQAIRQIEPSLHEETANVLCTLLSAEDIRSIAGFLATSAGQHYRMIRLSPGLQPEKLPAFLTMVRSIAEASRKW